MSLRQGPQGIAKARECWLRAAARGHAQAMSALGGLHLQQKEYSEAHHYFQQAAEKGHAHASFQKGQLCLQGLGLEKPDIEGAVGWFESAYKGGVADAALALGLLYSRGDVLEQDITKAMDMLKVAAELNMVEACKALGHLYRTRLDNDKAAISYYRQAADLGDCESQFNLASMLMLGKGTEKHEVEAVKYFFTASQQGHPQALFLMGRFVLEGRAGVAQNDKEAAKLFEAASRAGNPDAKAVLVSSILRLPLSSSDLPNSRFKTIM